MYYAVIKSKHFWNFISIPRELGKVKYLIKEIKLISKALFSVKKYLHLKQSHVETDSRQKGRCKQASRADTRDVLHWDWWARQCHFRGLIPHLFVSGCQTQSVLVEDDGWRLIENTEMSLSENRGTHGFCLLPSRLTDCRCFKVASKFSVRV